MNSVTKKSTKLRYRQRNNIKGCLATATERRSKSGCLTCRKRHKKCDETKPICGGCQENFLTCIWKGDIVCKGSEMFFTFHIDNWEVKRSQRSDRLNDHFISQHSFYRLTVNAKSAICEINERGRLRKLKKFPSIQTLDKCIKPEIRLDHCTKELSALNPHVSHLVIKKTPYSDLSLEIDSSSFSEGQQGAADLLLGSETPKDMYNFLFDDKDSLAQKFESIVRALDQGILSIIPIYCTHELFLLYVSVKHWLNTIGPQHTHPFLTTQVTFMRNFRNNNVLKEVFMCCGSAFMEYYDPCIFSKLSMELYESSLVLIQRYLENNSEHSPEPWILAAYQLLCLRNKLSFGSTVNDCISCLSKSYKIINSPYYVSKIKSMISTNERPVEELMLEMEQRHSLEPHDRMYLESFLYNYSVSILWANDISELPDPYTVYDFLGRALKCFVCQSDARWMNNPVFGATSEAFEILAKTSYIARLPMPLDTESMWFKRALQLLRRAQYFTPSVLPQSNVFDGKIQESGMMNLSVGQVVAKTSSLLISKVLNYSNFNILSCQDIVSDIVDRMDKIPRNENIWCILTWSLVICGVFAIDSNLQKKILGYLDLVRDKFHQLPIEKAKLFLFKTWALQLNQRLSILFDRESLTLVNA